ncbi:MAG: hypothetical protein JRI23_34350 [Deltaproteobacteria bacterium]|jgi:hypothetical protein|nr:hypothetical protein [Deltaproteobacteria bacterium]MBW2537380.1 hypothetical protein [Deltaproteobacteria bacterium]
MIRQISGAVVAITLAGACQVALAPQPSEGNGSPAQPEQSAQHEPWLRVVELAERLGLDALRAEATPAPSASPAVVELPSDAAGAVHVDRREGNVGVSFSLRDASPIPPVAAAAGVLFAGALGPGRDLVQRRTMGGVEDYVVFWQRPVQPSVSYDLDLRGAAGIRLVADVLELVDGRGTPVLRMAAPYVLAEDPSCAGPSEPCVRRIPVEVALSSCAYDSDPRGPWRRPVVPAGADSCALELRWDDDGVVYPAILDPSWTVTTNTMTSPRMDHAAARLADDTVLITGGADSVGDLDSAEIYDPTTDTFAATGSMLTARSVHLTAPLSNGQVIVTGGSGDTTVELYDAGSFSAGPAAPADFAWGTVTPLADERILFVGGWDDSQASGRFEPAPGGGGAWIATAPPLGLRAEHAAARLQDGRVLVTGGCDSVPNTSAELYDPTTNTWSAQPAMSSRHCGHTATTLLDGRVLIAGGIDHDWISVAAAELFSPPTGPGQGSWTSATSLNPARAYHRAALLGSGQVLLVAGVDVDWDEMASARIYDPIADVHTTTASLAQARSDFTLTKLANGTVLAAGGDLHPTVLDTAEAFTPSELGDPCATDGDCAVGECVDGVCCGNPCDGPCESCSAAEKGGGTDGLCELLPEGASDPFCTDEGPESCGKIGTCTAGGECALYPADTACGPVSCSGGSLRTATCDGSGVCVQTAQSCEPYLCASATQCGGSCSSHEDCGPDWYCLEDACEPKLATDEECTDDAECETGICTQGACATSAGCVDETTLEIAGGERIQCTPYRCRGGDCLTSCESVFDCAPGLICDGAGVCSPPPEKPSDEGGCSVANRQRTNGQPGLGLLALAAAWIGCWQSRRRRGRT